MESVQIVHLRNVHNKIGFEVISKSFVNYISLQIDLCRAETQMYMAYLYKMHGDYSEFLSI